MDNRLKRFLVSNTPLAKLTRTIMQAIISYVVVNLPMLLNMAKISPEMQVILVPVIMGILSPLMASIGGKMPDKGDPVQATPTMVNETNPYTVDVPASPIQEQPVERSASNGDL